MKSAFVVVLIAASGLAQSSAPAALSQTACGPMDVQFQIKTNQSQGPDVQAEPGKALVYVVEDQRFKAAREVTVRIGLDGAWIGATRGNSYLSFSVDPGEHHLCANLMPGLLSSNRLVSLFGLNAEAGKVYYLRARTSGGRSSALDRSGWDDTLSIDLDLVNGDEGKFLVAFSPVSVSHAKINKDGKN